MREDAARLFVDESIIKTSRDTWVLNADLNLLTSCEPNDSFVMPIQSAIECLLIKCFNVDADISVLEGLDDQGMMLVNASVAALLKGNSGNKLTTPFCVVFGRRSIECAGTFKTASKSAEILKHKEIMEGRVVGMNTNSSFIEMIGASNRKSDVYFVGDDQMRLLRQYLGEQIRLRIIVERVEESGSDPCFSFSELSETTEILPLFDRKDN